MTNPLLSIIIINYNTGKITLDCLKSIKLDKGLKDLPYEIILVDNASTDDSLKLFASIDKSVKLIKNKTNIGFANANNQAAKIASGNYLLLLNSDTLILHSAISQALDWLSSHPEAWGCTAQLLNSDKTIQPSGGYFPNILNLFTWATRLDDLPLINFLIKPFHPHSPDFYTHEKFFLTDHSQDWITGAFMMIRKNIFDSVNGFDTSYFMYGEEMEMCRRISKKFPQLSCWYLVGPQIIHLGGASSKSKKQVLSREKQGIRSFFKKHYPRWQLPVVDTFLKINDLLSHA